MQIHEIVAPTPGKYDTATLRIKLPQGKSAFILPFLILRTYPLFLSFFVWKASPPPHLCRIRHRLPDKTAPVTTGKIRLHLAPF